MGYINSYQSTEVRYKKRVTKSSTKPKIRGNFNMNMDKVLDKAIELDASDVHMICGNKPILRISRETRD